MTRLEEVLTALARSRLGLTSPIVHVTSLNMERSRSRAQESFLWSFFPYHLFVFTLYPGWGCIREIL